MTLERLEKYAVEYDRSRIDATRRAQRALGLKPLKSLGSTWSFYVTMSMAAKKAFSDGLFA
ncbi:hypothetical protein OH491_24815 [Termitidicoccus mucosus]|uniref:Uncharacterized protein n=1 Tax=Termitidicoccus mucosus TaxID=1184151 RepID=A0A178IPF2_9BACT|nr:hypothetical protein AW736_01710 [Opitutaceae bacterium TSB47]